MFKKTRKQILSTIEALKEAFRLFVVTVQNLTLAVEANTATLAANSATVAVNTAENRSLIDKFDEINKAARYLAHAKKNELTRSGHQS